MKKNTITLYDTSSIAGVLAEARQQATVNNLSSPFATHALQLFHSPDSGEGYHLADNSLVCDSGRAIMVRNGIPDFTVFSQVALDEKHEQASFHDDEEQNERFDEIVLRPFNYNHLHAKVWLGHLHEFTNLIEKTTHKHIRDVSILNCGCGGGFEAQFFAEQGAKVIGFDISQLRAEASATRFALNNLEGFFYRGDAAVLPFKNDAFDFVIYHDSLHHVPIEEIPRAVREACRVAANSVILFEAHDSPLRMLLESIGLSSSIERAGNYTFRFRKSLIEFWSKRYDMNLVNYTTRFMKKEKHPRIYKTPLLGYAFYSALRAAGSILRPLGNEAFILMQKKNVGR